MKRVYNVLAVVRVRFGTGLGGNDIFLYLMGHEFYYGNNLFALRLICFLLFEILLCDNFFFLRLLSYLF